MCLVAGVTKAADWPVWLPATTHLLLSSLHLSPWLPPAELSALYTCFRSRPLAGLICCSVFVSRSASVLCPWPSKPGPQHGHGCGNGFVLPPAHGRLHGTHVLTGVVDFWFRGRFLPRLWERVESGVCSIQLSGKLHDHPTITQHLFLQWCVCFDVKCLQKWPHFASSSTHECSKYTCLSYDIS